MEFSLNPKPKAVEGFLTEPTEEAETLVRHSCNFVDHGGRYKLNDRNFLRQYAHLYSERLVTLRPSLESAAKKKWGKGIVIRKMFELKSDESCVIIGTLFKQMELQPNILKEISDEHGLINQPVSGKYVSKSDKLILEDELQRIVLVGKLDIQASVTGVVVAVRGTEPEDDKGKFHVTDFCYAGMADQEPMAQLDEDRYIALVSGLELGSRDEEMFPLQMFVDMVTGQVGDGGQLAGSSNIVGVVVAGNSLSRTTQAKDSLTKAKYLTKNKEAGSVEAIKSLDDVLVQLVGSTDVVVMPGDYDPANFTLPQQPLHKCMFPQASRYQTMYCATNPADCSIGGARLIGTSGQPIQDILRYSSTEDPHEALVNCLRWRHIAPTAPDTLGCYPFYDKDPFVLTDCPHILFAGNQAKFKHSVQEGPDGQRVLVVTIPKFSTSRTVVLVNLRTLEAMPVMFDSEIEETCAGDTEDMDVSK